MRMTIIVVAAAALVTVCVVAAEKAAKNDAGAPRRALVVFEGVHGRDGIGQMTAISVVDRDKIAKLEGFFPNYRKAPASSIAAGWKTGQTIYFDFGKGQTLRVTVSGNDDGKTWSMGSGDFDTRGDLAAYLKELRELAESKY